MNSSLPVLAPIHRSSLTIHHFFSYFDNSLAILVRLTLCVGCLSWAMCLTAQEGTGTSSESEPVSSDVVRDWVAKLDSNSFRDRETATRKLPTLGRAAIGPTLDFAKTANREAGWRCIEVLRAICFREDRTARNEADAALEILAARKDPLGERAIIVLRDERTTRVRDASSKISALGGTITYQASPERDSYQVRLGETWQGTDRDLMPLVDLPNVTWLSMERSPIGNDGLAQIQELTRLEKLYLGQSKVTGEGLRYIRKLENISNLSLRGLKVANSDLENLSKLDKLETLGLDDTQISDAGLVHLGKLPKLQFLWLNRTKVTDQGLEALQPCQSLTKLYLSGTKVGGPGLAKLKILPKLNYLSLQGVTLSDADLVHLSEVTQLETLGLDDTQLTDAGLEPLKNLKQLKVLWVSNTALTDDGLSKLDGLPALKRIYAKGTHLTPTAIREFEEKHPDCKIDQ